VQILQLRRKHPSRLLWSVWVAFNVLILAVVLAAARYPLTLYIRNALFSETFDAQQLRSESQLNALIARRLRHDPPELNPRTLFTRAELAKLDEIVLASEAGNCRVATDHPRTRLSAADCIARALAEDVSPYMMGGKCGLDLSIRTRIGSVLNGVGCCSDYNEAFLLRAHAVGLQVREVHNLGHTTAEYFNPANQRWIWIDTSNRVQLSNEDGELLSSWLGSNRFPWRRLTLVDLPPFAQNKRQIGRSFAGYLVASNAVLSWSRGLNFQQQENLEAPMRQLGLPREVVQTVSLTLGVRPGWIVVAPGEVAFRFRLSAWLLRGSLLLFVMLNMMMFSAAMGWRLTRNRSYVYNTFST
jgi:hypothetical protein